jgi:hypothetical protein
MFQKQIAILRQTDIHSADAARQNKDNGGYKEKMWLLQTALCLLSIE